LLADTRSAHFVFGLKGDQSGLLDATTALAWEAAPLIWRP
jgi:hypothetical protein